MKSFIKLLIISIIFLGCRNSSTEDEIRLPDATQTGANTAGCLLDGKIFVAKNGIQNIGSTGFPYGILFSETFNLSFRNYERTDFVSLHFLLVNQTGEYPTVDYNDKAIEYQDNKTIIIKDGRFDINKNTLNK